jgi:short-subunit dehydrogenase
VHEGLSVAIADLDVSKLNELAAELDANVFVMALDVTDAQAYTHCMDEVERSLGALDYLINVAGIMPIGPFDAEPAELTSRVIAVNLNAVIASTKDAARRMKARGSGHILNVASGVGWVAGAGAATYCATKHAVVGYSESVKLELRGTGVEISVVAPAVIKTELSAGMKPVRGLRDVTPEEVADAIVDGMKRPRFAIFVPGAMGVLALSASALPYRLRHFLWHVTKTDTALLEADQNARAEYERGIALSARQPTTAARGAS